MRSYRYIILNRNARPALLHERVAWLHGKLDAERMHRAAQALPGERDFSSFRSAACQAGHARRFVDSVKVSRDGDFVYIDIRANAFLHHMVRNIVGSLIPIGRDEQPEDWLAWLLAQHDRTQAGPTAPAGGLYLVAVEYPDTYGVPCAVRLPRFV
jgi:tRNA pseudouridine38-40 synthase